MSMRSVWWVSLFIIACFSCWLMWRYVIQVPVATSAGLNTPDQFVVNLQIKVMDKHGQPLYEFFTPLLLHYAPDNHSHFILPQGKLYIASQMPWQFSAQSGDAWNGDMRIDLSGQVVALQAAGRKNEFTRITTNTLSLYPSQRLMTTTDMVKAEQPPAGYLQGKGMRLDLQRQTLDLLSQVQGEYISHAH